MGRPAYEALRHMYPELVLTLRCAIDNGVDPKKLLKIHATTEDSRRVATDALQYMRENDEAGVVRWRDGSYSFIEHVATVAET